MTFLAIIDPVFTLPYLKIFFFPWVIPLALLVELAVFVLLDPGPSAPSLALTVLIANLSGLVIGFILAFAAQLCLKLLLGAEVMDWQTYLLNLGLILALFATGAIKCLVWAFRFGPNPYLRRVVIVTHVLCFAVVGIEFLILPYFSVLDIPNIPFLS